MQCPHCRRQISATFNFQQLYLSSDQTWPAHDSCGKWAAGVLKCPACQRIVIHLGYQGKEHHKSWRVYPKAIAHAVPPEVPEEFASDFREANLVLPDSEKASAALSRRCLQHLIREKAG